VIWKPVSEPSLVHQTIELSLPINLSIHCQNV
jgi:hypothetical protein